MPENMLLNFTDISDNAIDGKKQKKVMNNELKEKHRDLKENFRYLEGRVQNKVRVYSHWTIAMSLK